MASQLRLSTAEQALRDQQDVQDELLFQERFKAENGPAAKRVIGPASKATAEDLGLAGSEPPPQADFDTLFRQQVNIGSKPGQVPLEAVNAKGGLPDAIDNIQAEEQFKTPGIREINDVLSNLLGTTSGTQRARPEPREMSKFQKGMLFVSDIIATAEGRVTPSSQLDTQRYRAFTLAEQQQQEAWKAGVPAVRDFVDLISKLSPEDRVAAAIQQIPQLRRNFGEGFGAIALALASKPTAAESFKAFADNEPVFKGGASDRIIRMATFLAGAGEMEEAIKLITDTGIKGGIFDLEAAQKSPAVLARKLPGFLNELRELGGNDAAFANHLDQGGTITASQVINYNDQLPLNSPNRLDPMVIRALETNPELFAADLPGLVTPAQQQKYQELLNAGELSEPVNMIAPKGHPEEGRVTAVPRTSAQMRNLLKQGYVVLDRLTGMGGSGVLVPTITEINSTRQEFLRESKYFKEINDKFETIARMMPLSTPASDVSMIFAYMKILDPTSVVREGEQATAKNAGTVPAKVWRMYNNALAVASGGLAGGGGGRVLGPQQKEDFFEAAVAIWDGQAKKQVEREGIYEDLAQLLNIPDSRLIKLDLIGEMRNFDPSKVQREGQPAPAATPEPEDSTPPQSEIDRAYRESGGDMDKTILLLQKKGYTID